MKSVGRFLKWITLMAATTVVLALVPGCDSGGDDDSGGGGSVVGTWVLDNGSGETTWWAFNADGTFIMYNDAALTSKHLGGTFTQDGNKVTGPFTNPGVGEGEIDCTLGSDGKTMQMDFIEHWHSPSKHVPLTGTKL